MKVYDEIKEIAPILLQYSKKFGPDTPDGYFMDLQDKVWQRLNIEDGVIPEHYFESFQKEIIQNVNQKNRIMWLQYIPGIAASMILIIVAASVLNLNLKSESFSIEPELALYYFENNIDNWQIETLAEYGILNQEDIETYTYDENIDNMYLESLDPEELDIELLEILE